MNYRTTLYTLCYLILQVSLCTVSGIKVSCDTTINPNSPHYLIAHGSLMERNSQLRLDENAGEPIPVRVHGYRRIWNTYATREKRNVTLLGIVEDNNATFNGAVFLVHSNSTFHHLLPTDEGTEEYCRKSVPIQQLHFIGSNYPSTMFEDAIFSIYTTKTPQVNGADENHPIMLSYVDVFIGGCMEIEKSSQLDGFAAECLISTDDWTIHWIKNRNSSIDARQSEEIDKLISGLDIFPNIKYQNGAPKYNGWSLFSILFTIFLKHLLL